MEDRQFDSLTAHNPAEHPAAPTQDSPTTPADVAYSDANAGNTNGAYQAAATQQAPQQAGTPPINTPHAQLSPQANRKPIAPQTTSGIAIAGMVLGIVAIATSFVPIVNNVSFFIALIGVVLSIIGLVGINKGKNKGRGIAIAGIVLGVVSIVVVLGTQAAFMSALDSITSTSNTTAEKSQTASSNAAGSAASPASAEDAAAANANSAATNAKYEVSIDEAFRGTDYNGDPAVAVKLSWQNNSDSATSFMAVFATKCYQDGVELDTAFGMQDVDTEGYLTSVKPGYGTNVCLTYKLRNAESPIEVEVGPLINFTGEATAKKTFTL